jgi:hypothetical protein
MTTNVMNPTETTSTLTTRWRVWLPAVLWIAAAALILASITQPYWGLVLSAPQYPEGLEMRVFINQMTGDADPALDEVREIDGLNHYIGMQSLYNAAQFERSIAIPALVLMSVLLVVAGVWRKPWTWLLTLPAVSLPFVFLADLGLWMRYYGQNLDPYAPLSTSIQPFVPPVLGEGVIGQFATVSYVSMGWFMALGAAVLIVVGIVVRLMGTKKA